MSKQQSSAHTAAAANSQKLITSYYSPLTSFPSALSAATSNNNNNAQSTPTKCIYCMSGLDQVWIMCAECDNFHMCLKCFSMSAEIGEHRKDHNYYVKSTASFPIFDGESLWTFKEELILLQNIEQYGFGNWEDIAKHLSNRTPEDCMQHYYSYYIYGNLGKSILNQHEINGCPVDQSCDTLSSLSLNGGKKVTKNGTSKHHHNNHSNNMISGSSSSLSGSTSISITSPVDHQLTVILPPVEMSLEEQRALGYMPLRDDYEREYKNDAESLISNIMLASQQLVYVPVKSEPMIKSEPDVGELNEEQLDYELKFNLIDIYRERLKDRTKYKKIARDYGLVNSASALINNYTKYLNGLVPTFNATECTGPGRKKKYNCFNDREMMELNDKMKKFVQFMAVSEYETLLCNLRRQRQLYNRIDRLRKCRTELGMRSLAEMDEYTRAKQQRKLTKPKRFSYLLSLSKRVTRGVSSRTQSPIKSATRRGGHHDDDDDDEEVEDEDIEDDEIDELAMMASPSKRRRSNSVLNSSISNGHNGRSSTRKNGVAMAIKPARAAAAIALNGTNTPSRNLRGRRSLSTTTTPVKNLIKYDDDIYDDEDDDKPEWEEETVDDEESSAENGEDGDQEQEEDGLVTEDEESETESENVPDDSTTLSSSNDCAVYQVNEENMSATGSSINRPRRNSRTPVKAKSPIKKKANGTNGSLSKINKKRWSLSNSNGTKKITDKKKKTKKLDTSKRAERLYSINGFDLSIIS